MVWENTSGIKMAWERKMATKWIEKCESMAKVYVIIIHFGMKK